MEASTESRKVQTTLRLPRPLYCQAKSVVEERIIEVETFNELVVIALRAYLKKLRRIQIDQEFAGMAVDTNYQKDAQILAADFEESDWEALETTEVDREVDASR